MVIGLETARLGIGRTNATDVGNVVTLSATVAAAQGTMEVSHDLAQNLHQQGDGGVGVEVTAEVAVTANPQGRQVVVLQELSYPGMEVVVCLVALPHGEHRAVLLVLLGMARALMAVLVGMLVVVLAAVQFGM